MPMPVSVTRNSTWPSVRVAASTMEPLGGVNFKPLLIKLEMICFTVGT